MHNTEIDTDVIIAGAGPTGLTLANLLARWEIPFCLLDRKSHLSRESKAFNLHARTLEIFDQIGIAEQAIREGDTDNTVQILLKEKTVAGIDLREILPGETPYPYFLIIPQDKTEQLLLDSLKSNNSQVLWEHELKELKELENGVEAAIAGPANSVKKIRGKYIVGCDGAGSIVRKQTGFSYEGKTYSPTFYLADAEVHWKYPHGNIYFSLTREHMTAFFPFREKNKFRIFNFMNTAVEKKQGESLSLEDIRKIVDSNPHHDITVKNPEWLSVFKIHSRLPDAFSRGRVILAGDAASVHSPVGGQGMNTGIQDSYNLAWKLALVVKGMAGPRLLDTYHEERYQIAKNLHKTTDRFFNLITHRSWLAGFFRTRIFPLNFKLLTGFRPLRERAFRRFSQIGVKYRFSSMSLEGTKSGFKRKAPNAGDRAPFSRLILNQQKTDTSSLMDCDRFTVLLAVSDINDKRIVQLRDFLSSSAIPLDIHVIPAGNGGNEFHKTYGVKRNALFIVRPDGHIGFRTSELSAKGPAKYFRNIFSGSS